MIRDLDDSKAPLLDHLIELRRRLLWCVATLLAGFFVCLYFAKPIFAVLVQPLLKAGQGTTLGAGLLPRMPSSAVSARQVMLL